MSVRAGGVVAIALSFGMLAACQSSGRSSTSDGAYLHASAWRAAPKGTFNITEGGQPGSGTRVGVDDELGVDPHVETPLGLDLASSRHRFSVEYLRLRFSGDRQLAQPFVFHNAHYQTGDQTHTDLSLDTWKARYDYVLWTGRQLRIHQPVGELRTGIVAFWWQFDARIRDDTANFSERREFSHIYPGPSLSGRYPLGAQFDLTGEASAGLLGTDRVLTDLSADLGWLISENARFSIGYRYVRFDLTETTNDVNVRLEGPFAEFTYRF